MNGHTAHKNELAATQGPCAIYLRDISRKVGAPPANVPSQEADGAGKRHSEGALAACGGGVCQGGPTPESGGVHFGGSRRSGLRKPRGGL